MGICAEQISELSNQVVVTKLRSEQRAALEALFTQAGYVCEAGEWKEQAQPQQAVKPLQPVEAGKPRGLSPKRS